MKADPWNPNEPRHTQLFVRSLFLYEYEQQERAVHTLHRDTGNANANMVTYQADDDPCQPRYVPFPTKPAEDESDRQGSCDPGGESGDVGAVGAAGGAGLLPVRAEPEGGQEPRRATRDGPKEKDKEKENTENYQYSYRVKDRTEDTGQNVPDVRPNSYPASGILQFLAAETRLFHEHLQKVKEEYEKTHKMPESLFGVKRVRKLQKTSGKRATVGYTRGATVYNLFIKKRIAEIKASEPEETVYTKVFRRVVDEWNTLTPEEKKALDGELRGGDEQTNDE